MTQDSNARAIDRFQIHRRLGAGSMGVVFEASDLEREHVVALKTLPNAEANALYRFKREFRTLADISHPNLVNLYELFVEPGHCFFTMEKVDGQGFVAYVRPTGQIGELDTLSGKQGSTVEHMLPEQTRPGRPLAAELEADARRRAQAKIGTPTLSDETLRPGQAPPSRTGRPTGQPSRPSAGLDDIHTDATMLAPSTGEREGALVEGVSARGTLNEERLRDALRQLVEGVIAIHSAGKLHRDLKPSNVMVTADGRVVILDFGLATELRGKDGQQQQGEGLAGTAGYMAPEQVDGECTPASDWYGVGVMIYEALTGRLPFTGPLIQVLMDKRQRDPVPPDQLVSGLPTDLVSLCTRLLSRDPSLRPTPAELLAAFGAAEPASQLLPAGGLGERALVGRDEHLAALADAVETVKDGEAVSVYVHGLSGAGKSALVRAFVASLQSSDAVILRGRCYVHESVPYKALDGVVDSLSRFLCGLPTDEARRYIPRDIRALARLFPVMRSVLDAVKGTDRRVSEIYDRLELRRRAFAALRELLARIGDQRLVVLYIDDLQWADADSALLLEELLRPPEAPLLLMLATFRSEEVDKQPFLKELLSHTGTRTCRQLPVGPLTDVQVRELVELLLVDVPVARVFIPTIVREAAGSPFLAEQLSIYVLTGDNVAATGVGLSEMLSARIGAQPTGGRALVNALAVAAHPLTPAIAAQAAGLSGDERPLIKSLVTSKLVRETGTDERIEMYHDRIRENLAARLPMPDVQDIHRRLAETMEANGLDDPEALFGHYRGAGLTRKAALFAARAAEKAAEALAFDQAAQFFRHALDHAPEGRDDGTEASRLGVARLERGLGDAYANAGRCREAAHAYMRAAKLGNVQDAVELRRAAAEQLMSSGHIDEGRTVLDEVLGYVGWRLPPTPKRALLSLLARRVQLKIAGYDFTETPASQVPPSDLLKIDICWGVSTSLSLTDNIRGADFAARGALLSLKAGEPVRVSRAMTMEAAFLSSGGGPNRDTARVLSKRALELAKKTRDDGAIAQATMIAGAVAYLAGEWRDAANLAGEADVMLRERCPGLIWQRVSALRFTLGAIMYLGEIGELRRRMPFALRDAAERGNLFSDNDLKARIFMHWLADDDPEGHRQAIADALARWPGGGFHIQHFNAMRSRVHGYLYECNYGAARSEFDDCWPQLKGSLLLRVQLVRVEASQLRVGAALGRMVSGSVTKSERRGLLKMADKELKAIYGEKMPWATPIADALRAGVLGQRGDQDGMRQTLEKAIEGLRGADMGLHAAACERQLGRIIGGDEGAGLVARADASMTAQQIRRPDRVAQSLAPGFFAE